MGEDGVQQGSPLRPFIFFTECLSKTNRPREHFMRVIVSCKTITLELRSSPLPSHALIFPRNTCLPLHHVASCSPSLMPAVEFQTGCYRPTHHPAPPPPSRSRVHRLVLRVVDSRTRRGGILPLMLMSLRMSSYCCAINSRWCTGWESQQTETEAETWESDPISVRSCARMSGCFVITHVFSSFPGPGCVPT